MENNRYREEEKEFEKNNPIKEEVREESVVDEEVVEQISSKDSKGTKKLKSKIQNLEEENAELKVTIAALHDQLLRNQAELENFKKRTQEERIKERKYAMQDFFSEIIPTIDVFNKACNIKTEDEKLQKFLKGFAMIDIQLGRTLESYGVSKIEALNKPFDPALHEASEVIDVEGVDSDIVVEVITEGYIYKDRVLRPSVVKVSK